MTCIVMPCSIHRFFIQWIRYGRINVLRKCQLDHFLHILEGRVAACYGHFSNLEISHIHKAQINQINRSIRVKAIFRILYDIYLQV
ncbi:hypothetical protein D1872_251220 [compost metagenome]